MRSPRALLFVEEEAARAAFSSWLAEAGCGVDVAADEANAATLLDQARPALFVTSRIVPHGTDLGGRGALRDRHPDTRVVALIDQSTRGDFSPALAGALGFDAVLVAPFRRAEAVEAFKCVTGIGRRAETRPGDPAAATWSEPRFSPT
jgi:CheY-like chemotaxis protein